MLCYLNIINNALLFALFIAECFLLFFAIRFYGGNFDFSNLHCLIKIFIK